jgi:5-methylcytosine-specific restriction endonuclease McrA
MDSGERILLTEVARRDGWTCRLCGGLVDMTLEYPDRASKSLDHRFPISRGGKHVLANVQLAHLGCNLDKRDRIGN